MSHEVMSLRLSKQIGATPLTERSLAPDLARGFMLLWIALANSHYFLTGGSTGNGVLGGFPRDGSSLDAAITWLISTFVDGRAYPMFGLLFGYGVAQIVRRQADASPRAVRKLLWRRSGVLVLVGFLHGLLLYVGDILTAYGVLLFLAAWTVRWRDRALLVLAACFFVLTSLPGGGSLSTSAAPPDPAMLPPNLAAMLTSRPPIQLLIALIGPIGFACPFLVGLWAGRRQLLADPAQHRTLLRLTAVLGLGAAVLGAQPVSLMLAGVRPVPGPSKPQRHRDAARLHWRSRWVGVCSAHRADRSTHQGSTQPVRPCHRRDRPAVDELLPHAVSRVGAGLHPVPARPVRHADGCHDSIARDGHLVGHRGGRGPDASVGTARPLRDPDSSRHVPRQAGICPHDA